MRTAIALPSLARDAPLRRSLERVVDALSDSGLQLEAFAEMARVREGASVPVFHYLRFPERHGARPFEAALWPLGRDGRTWEPAWILSRRYTGTVWILDGPLHHAAMGGIGIPGHWDLYGRLLEEALEEPDPAFSLFASGWASRAAYRMHDPLRRRLERREQCLSAVSAGDPGTAGSGETIPLPAASSSGADGGEPAIGESVAILSMDVIRPVELMSALAEVLADRPGLRVSIGIPEPTYHVRVAPAAHRAGIAERIRWILSPGPDELLRELRRTALAVFLDVDMNAADRTLLEHGLGLGRPTVALDIPTLADVPEPPLVKLRPGAALGPGLATALDALLDDLDLQKALGASGRAWFEGRPGAGEIARRLLAHLGTAPVRERAPDTGDREVWTALAEEMRTTCLPATAPAGVRELVERLLGQALPAASRAGGTRRPT